MRCLSHASHWHVSCYVVIMCLNAIHHMSVTNMIEKICCQYATCFYLLLWRNSFSISVSPPPDLSDKKWVLNQGLRFWKTNMYQKVVSQYLVATRGNHIRYICCIYLCFPSGQAIVCWVEQGKILRWG
jgi:hypothetical protein